MDNRANWNNLSIHMFKGVNYTPYFLFPVQTAPYMF